MSEPSIVEGPLLGSCTFIHPCTTIDTRRPFCVSIQSLGSFKQKGIVRRTSLYGLFGGLSLSSVAADLGLREARTDPRFSL
jgi:hypothetical protein